NHEETLKMVNNLDRAGVEARLAQVRAGAQSAGLGELAQMFAGIEGAPRAQIEEKVKRALKWLAGKPEQRSLVALLELVEINLPNLK
ncbi:MAG: hypothetical protein OEX78_17775, partial [Betaproteobacteria bacterium]|nr:hypothetical protein [Betaproteobacteria bacterium]